MKDLIDPPVSTQPTNLNEIQVEQEFNWSTSKDVEIHITGLPTIQPVYSTLNISLNDGSSLYQGFHSMSENLVIRVNIPTEVSDLNLQFGKITYNLTIETNRANFSFIPTITE
jgi:hypothetical protein